MFMTAIIPLTLSNGDSGFGVNCRIIGQNLDVNEIDNFAG
jgi:hypothetical protein